MLNVRVCLNDCGYTKPSGGYKAHSKNRKNANAHKYGIGLEEWIASPLNVRSGKVWMAEGIFRDLEPDALYRVAFLEAFRVENYRRNASRLQKHHVQGVVNDARNSWKAVFQIRDLRGLTVQESQDVLGYFQRVGVIAQMQAEEAAAHALSRAAGIVYPTHQVIDPSRSAFAIDTFTCLFKVDDFEYEHASRVVQVRIPNRYRYRY